MILFYLVFVSIYIYIYVYMVVYNIHIYIYIEIRMCIFLLVMPSFIVAAMFMGLEWSWWMRYFLRSMPLGGDHVSDRASCRPFASPEMNWFAKRGFGIYVVYVYRYFCILIHSFLCIFYLCVIICLFIYSLFTFIYWSICFIHIHAKLAACFDPDRVYFFEFWGIDRLILPMSFCVNHLHSAVATN